MRVLLVEDEPEMAAALRAALTRHDMIVDHAPNLFEAEAITALSSYDALVLDRQLPDGDGLTLIPKLRARGNLVPVFDLKLCLGLEGTTQERQYLLVLDEGNNAVGFFLENLPLPVSEGRKLVRPPPLPMALQGHGVEAYSLHNDIWVEFNHREFFQSLTMQTTATA